MNDICYILLLMHVMFYETQNTKYQPQLVPSPHIPRAPSVTHARENDF